MKHNLYVKDYLVKFENQQENKSVQDAYLLSGSLQLYLATGDIEYKDFISRYVEAANGLNDLAIGKVLFYLYEETKEEKYRKAIEEIVKKGENSPKDLEEFYMVMPTYAEYGTKIGKKENYNDIITQFKNIRATIKTDSEKELYLMTLVETLEVMSEEIFEHYKTLEVFAKEAIKEMENSSVVRAYGILKACRLKDLLKEKYQEVGSKILDSVSEPTFPDHKNAGTFMMAYAQLLLLGKEE